jgi:predicted ester cyclase
MDRNTEPPSPVTVQHNLEVKMSAEHKAVVQRFYKDVLEGGDLSAVDQIAVQDVVDHTPAPGQGPGAEGVKQFVSGLRRGLSNLQVDVERMVAEGDLIACHITVRGRHTGELFGAPPSGKDVAFRIADMVRLRDGKVIERWGVEDMSGLMA